MGWDVLVSVSALDRSASTQPKTVCISYLYHYVYRWNGFWSEKIHEVKLILNAKSWYCFRRSAFGCMFLHHLRIAFLLVEEWHFTRQTILMECFSRGDTGSCARSAFNAFGKSSGSPLRFQSSNSVVAELSFAFSFSFTSARATSTMSGILTSTRNRRSCKLKAAISSLLVRLWNYVGESTLGAAFRTTSSY